MHDTTQPSARSTVRIDLLGGFQVSVDGEIVDAGTWARRHASGLVKVLGLAPGRRLHREQVIDALWPDESVVDAAPKLHKAAHYARRSLGIADAIVTRGDQISLCPDHEVEVDAVRFEELARQAMAGADRRAASAALELYRGELLPEDRYAEWVEEPRDRLAMRHLDLLRLDERWDELLELDPADERAHVELMRRYATAGDRHGALRQFDRLDRHVRGVLGVGPGRDATALREQLLTAAAPARRNSVLVGRERELAELDLLMAESASLGSRTVFVTGAAGMGKSALLGHLAEMARAANFRVARGVAASIEGGWPYAPVVEALADLCRHHPALLDGLADGHRDELDQALAGPEGSWSGESSHQRLFVAAAELVRLASATSGLLITLDDLHDADDGSLRLLHYIARSTNDSRVLIALGHRPSADHHALTEMRVSLIERHGAVDMPLSPLDADDARRLAVRTAEGVDDALVAHIVELADGVPFAVCELARRAAREPSWAMSLDAHLVAGVDPDTKGALQRVALIGMGFDTDEFVALSAMTETDAYVALDRALEAGLIEPASSGYRFRHALVRDALVGDMPPHRRRAVHRDAAARLIEAGESAARIGHHLLEAGSAGEAVPYLLSAAETDAAVGAYRDALKLVDAVRLHATGSHRVRALALRGDLLNALGDPMAASAYREALDGADGADVPRLRARLARTSVMSGDLVTAAAALDGLEPDGGDYDADVLLARGNYAYFTGDFETAASVVAAAEQMILSGQQNWKVLDLVSLQGLLAHRLGQWFDRIRLEIKRTRTQPDVAMAIFDGHLCATEFMLYGATPYAEVIEVAGDLRRTARRSGALRAEAFAAVLIGEAAFLSGDLDLADAELTEAADLHRDLGSPAGEAVALQRLAEVRLAQGDNEAATDLLDRALPLAQSSLVANHLMERVYGTLIAAAPDPVQARVVVDRAESILGWDESCAFCAVMLAVPAATACARAGDVDHAHRHLAVAERSSELWRGTSWEAAVDEARATVALARDEPVVAATFFASAAAGFARAGQPLDADRCRRALAGCPT